MTARLLRCEIHIIKHITVQAAFSGEVFNLDAEQAWTLADLEQALPLHLQSSATRTITWMHDGRVLHRDPHA